MAWCPDSWSSSRQEGGRGNAHRPQHPSSLQTSPMAATQGHQPGAKDSFAPELKGRSPARPSLATL